mmetsp:Transcript_10803/g.16071  ORF Transcript_10803/g.16071 Transcript_10803/m.16071 type:complete len:195 (-) Transcript_10803:360-944(-)
MVSKKVDRKAMLLKSLIGGSIVLCSPTMAFSNRMGGAQPWRTQYNVGRKTALSAMADTTDLIDENMNDILKGETPVLIDVYAPWCGPCRLIEPVLERCAEKWSGEVNLVKYDAESKNKGVKMEFVMGGVHPDKLPSLILYKDGKPVAKRAGMITDDEIDQFLSDNLKLNVPKKGRGFIKFGSSSESDDYMLTAD